MATVTNYPIDLPILVIEAQIFVAVNKFQFLPNKQIPNLYGFWEPGGYDFLTIVKVPSRNKPEASSNYNVVIMYRGTDLPTAFTDPHCSATNNRMDTMHHGETEYREKSRGSKKCPTEMSARSWRVVINH